MVAVDILRDHGCEVMEAAHASAAIEVLHRQADELNAIITDISMPGIMDGLGLAHYAAQHWPWITTLIVSARPRPATQVMPPLCQFLPKPYDHSMLYARLCEMAAA